MVIAELENTLFIHICEKCHFKCFYTIHSLIVKLFSNGKRCYGDVKMLSSAVTLAVVIFLMP